MKNLKKSSAGFFGKNIIIPVLVLGLMVFVLIYGMRWFGKMNNEQNRALIEQSIKKAAIQCYSNEGMYPADVDYLVENYYVTIDHDKYNIVYDCFASNIMPTIRVYLKGGSDE